MKRTVITVSIALLLLHAANNQAAVYSKPLCALGLISVYAIVLKALSVDVCNPANSSWLAQTTFNCFNSLLTSASQNKALLYNSSLVGISLLSSALLLYPARYIFNQ